MDEYQMLMQYLQQNPEALQKIIDSGLVPQRQKLIQAEQERMQPWMDTAQPKGQTVGPYGAYVAANPLEHLAAAFRNVAGMKRIGQGDASQLGLLQQLGEGRKSYLDMLNEQQAGIQTIPSAGTGGEF